MQCLDFQVGIEVTHKPSLNVNSSCFCCHPLRSWSLAHTPWGLWHFIHCIPVHPRSFANPDGFTTHAGGLASPLASWFLGSPTPVTHCHVAIAPHSQSHDLNHVLPGKQDWNLIPLSPTTTFQPFSPFLLCSQEGWSLGLLRLPVPWLYSFLTHQFLMSLLLFPTSLDSTMLHFCSSTKWSLSPLPWTFGTVLEASDLHFKSILYTAVRVIFLLNCIILLTCLNFLMLPVAKYHPLPEDTVLPQYPYFCTC